MQKYTVGCHACRHLVAKQFLNSDKQLCVGCALLPYKINVCQGEQSHTLAAATWKWLQWKQIWFYKYFLSLYWFPML